MKPIIPSYERELKIFNLHSHDNPETILAGVREKAQLPLPDDLKVKRINSAFADAEFPLTEFGFIRKVPFGSDESMAMLRNLTDAIQAAYPNAYCIERHQRVERRLDSDKNKCGR